MIKALTEATPEIRYYPNFSIAGPLKSWVYNNRITFIGDAAHAHGGAFATGGSIAIDDAYAFSLAISHVFPISASQKPTQRDIDKALHIYEATRKPHADRLLNLVHKGIKSKNTRAGKALSDEELRNQAAQRPDTVWLHEHDVVGTIKSVLAKFEQENGLKSGKESLSAKL